MKKIFTLFIFILLCKPFDNYGQGWQWATAAITAGNDAWLMKTDKYKNVFLGGDSYADSTCLGGDTIFSNQQGTTQSILAKYDSSGNLLWFVSSSNGFSQPIDMVLDTDGNSYLFGAFSDTIVFGTYTVTASPQSGYDYNSYLVKFDGNGNVVWAETIGKVESNAPWACPKGMAADNNGYMYISGAFKDSVTQIGTYVLHNQNPSGDSTGYATDDIFLAKLDLSGNVIWAKQYGGNGFNYPRGLTMSATNELYMTGIFTSPTVNFGSTTLTYGGTYGSGSMFLVKLDSAGNPIWANSSSADMAVQGLSMDQSYNLYIGGSFIDSNIAFDSIILHDPAMFYGGLFVKYDSNGHAKWAKALLGTDDTITENNEIMSVASDGCNSTWICGWLAANIQLDDTTILYQPAGYASQYTMFFARYDSSGNLMEDQAIPSGGETSSGITIDMSGNMYLCSTNWINAPFSLGSIVLDPQEATLFLAKYQPSEQCETILPPIHHPTTFMPSIPPPPVNAYPNPASNTLIISYDDSLYKNATVDIYDITGRLIHNYPLSGNNTVISVSDLLMGIYHCKINLDETHFVHKKILITR